MRTRFEVYLPTTFNTPTDGAPEDIARSLKYATGSIVDRYGVCILDRNTVEGIWASNSGKTYVDILVRVWVDVECSAEEHEDHLIWWRERKVFWETLFVQEAIYITTTTIGVL